MQALKGEILHLCFFDFCPLESFSFPVFLFCTTFSQRPPPPKPTCCVIAPKKQTHFRKRERKIGWLRKWWKQGDVVDFLPFNRNKTPPKREGDWKTDSFSLLASTCASYPRGIRLVFYCRVRLLVCISAHYGTAAHMQKVHSVPYWRAKHRAVWVDVAPPIASHQISAYPTVVVVVPMWVLLTAQQGRISQITPTSCFGAAVLIGCDGN